MTRRIRLDFSRLKAGEAGYLWRGDADVLMLANRIDELYSPPGECWIVGFNRDNCTADFEVPVDFSNSCITGFDYRINVQELSE